MSRFRTAAMGAVVLLGMAGVAGAQVQARTGSAGKWNGRHGQMSQRGKQMRARGGRDGHGKLMADLNLTDAQKNQIKAIHAKYEPQMKAIREEGKAQFGSMRDMRQKGDTSAATRAKFEQQREQFRAKSMIVRQAEERDVRAILTADQLTRWDAAQAQRKQRTEARMKGMNVRGAHRGKGRKA